MTDYCTKLKASNYNRLLKNLIKINHSFRGFNKDQTPGKLATYGDDFCPHGLIILINLLFL